MFKVDITSLNREDFQVKKKNGEYLIVPTHTKHRWDEGELHLRSLVVNENGQVLSRGFNKFRNFGESEDDTREFLWAIENNARMEIFEKLDGCFPSGTALNLWDGGTITIGDIVRNRLTPTLIGADEEGNLVPTKVIGWHNNGTKQHWLRVTVSNDTSVGKGRGGNGGHPNGILVTPNHEIWTEQGYKLAGELVPGDTLKSARVAPDELALHSIRAGLLGDGSISVVNDAAVYTVGHKVEHADYVAAKSKWLGSFGRSVKPQLSGYGTVIHRTASLTTPTLLKLREEWYPHGVRAVPEDLSWVDDFAVAVWYMDNGSLATSEFQQDRAIFHTNRYSREDTLRLADKLTTMYGVDCAVYFSKGWCIRVNAGKNGEIDKLWSRIAPHVVPVMRYKLPERYRDVPYIERGEGAFTYEAIESVVLSVERLGEDAPIPPRLARSRTGFDITTETGNYFARGVLVHNSLLIVDQVRPGELRFRTRGSHDLGEFEEPIMKLVNEKYNEFGFLKSDVPFFREHSFLFEYVGPENKIVVDYEEPELYFLDYIRKDRAIERWPKAPARSMFATLGGMKLAPSLVMKPQDLLKNPPSGQNSEGVVVKFEDSKRRVRRLKFKTPWYVKLHAMRFNMNEKRAGLLAYLLGVSTIEELPEALEGFGIDYEASKFIEPYVIDYLARKRSVEARVMAMLADIKDNAWGLLPRKEYVNTVREHYPDLFNIAMLVYDRREIEDAVASRYLDMPPAHIAQLLGDRETTINSMLKVPDVE